MTPERTVSHSQLEPHFCPALAAVGNPNDHTGASGRRAPECRAGQTRKAGLLWLGRLPVSPLTGGVCPPRDQREKTTEGQDTKRVNREQDSVGAPVGKERRG